MPRENTRRVHPANVALAALGLLGIGITLGGWAAQPSESPVVGVAVEDRTSRLMRVHADGSVTFLNLGSARGAGGMTNEQWQAFKSP